MLKYLVKGLNIIGAAITGYVLIDTAYKLGFERGKEEATANSELEHSTNSKTLNDFITNLKSGETHKFVNKNGAELKIKVL